MDDAEMTLASRNTSEGFAERTLRNLKFIQEASYDGRTQVHPITQLTNSFLGLMVFPWAELVDEKTKSLMMVDLYEQGWPKIAIDLDGSSKIDSATLHGMIEHLRNSICHQRFHFSSESTNPDFVKITFEDAPRGKNAKVKWSATLMASDLDAFCTKFIELVLGVVG